jgi:hypothetical protein
LSVSVTSVPGRTLCELTDVTTVGCVSTRNRSADALQGVVRPSVLPSPGTTSWYTYKPGASSFSAGVVKVPFPLAESVP